jgi:hypothetical protein
MAQPLRETLQQAGYEHLGIVNGYHRLRDISTGKVELWFANKNHASYGIIWRNTHLEFARSE